MHEDGVHLGSVFTSNYMTDKPKRDERIVGRQGYGLIQVFTGDGKGKTTAALGEAVRAHGAGKRVTFVYFDKGGDAHYSERKTLDELGIPYVVTGRDRIDPVTGRFDFSVIDEDREEVVRGLGEAERLFGESYDLVVLDELNTVMGLEMVSVERVVEVLRAKPEKVEVILTGRNAPSEIIDEAHLVTEIGMKKHYFYSGVQAREGLDY